jgi:hypothetical protein
MRLFLALMLFDMVFHSLSVILPWPDWIDDLGMREMPVRLDTYAEREQKLEGWDGTGTHPAVEDALSCADSIWEFIKPWPGPAARPRIRNWRDGGKFVVCWLNSRLSFVEALVGIDEQWPMFAPFVRDYKDCVRADLIYADGSVVEVRQVQEPADPTHYAHWFQEKVMNYEARLRKGGQERFLRGWCNMLAHRYGQNSAGAELVSIRLFSVRYIFPPPEADARAFWRAQQGPPADQVSPPFYLYDVASRDGKRIPP